MQSAALKTLEQSMQSSMSKLSLLPLILLIGGCIQTDYDPKALGFSDRKEMESAFAKGYHTKQKLIEMSPPPPSVAAVVQPAVEQPISNIANSANQTSAPEKAESENSIDAAQPATSSDKNIVEASTCADVISCMNAMLASAKVENLGAAMDAARRIDSFPKPERGDRESSRKLNDLGLLALKQGKNLDAINFFTKAKELNGLDEEILDNLVFTYIKDGNYTKAASIAPEGFNLNPRRASLWLNYSEANLKLGKHVIALQAMWLTWQFSPNKEKFIKYIDKKISETDDFNLKTYYEINKAWFLENNKPTFQ